MKRLVIATGLALPLLVSACEVSPDLTPDEVVRVHELELELNDRATQIELLEGQVEAAIDAYEDAVRRGDVEALEAARLSVSSLIGQYKIASTKAQVAAEEIDDVYAASYERMVGPVGTVLQMLPPGPWKAAGLFLPQILVWTFSKRARERLKEGVLAGVKGNLAELGAGVLKSVGALHSTPTSGTVAEEEIAAKKAETLMVKAENVKPRTA